MVSSLLDWSLGRFRPRDDWRIICKLNFKESSPSYVLDSGLAIDLSMILEFFDSCRVLVN